MSPLAVREATFEDLPKDIGMDDDRLLPSILIRGMNEGLRFREELQEAEASVRRLQHELALATERVEVLRARYDMNAGFVRDVWGTLKGEWLKRWDVPA